ncbi:MAG: hypothetical protein VX473_03540 [Candidatus Thermoplasmatota archaeon]|nr:hypothetical protein [Candidatus Thermoplasmatota archaeon]
MSEITTISTRSNYRAQVTRLNLILDEHLRLIQESVTDKHARDARRSIRQARQDIDQLKTQVGRMHRSIGMLHTIVRERSTSETELVDVLLTMKTAETLILRGAFDEASLQLERLVEHLLINSAALNPFIFYEFWMGVEARWEPGSENGQLLVRVENTSLGLLPGFNVKAPVPPNWRSSPASQSIMALEPGQSCDLVFTITPSAMASIREVGAPGSLQEKLTIQAGYNLTQEGLTIDCRVENISAETMTEVLVTPWVPPGWKTNAWPYIRMLEPNQVEFVTIHLDLAK